MSSCKSSTGRSEIVLGVTDSSFTFRVKRVFAIIVLLLFVLVIPVGSQLNQPTCGKRQKNSVFLIANGATSKLEDWPWHVAIYRQDDSNLTYVCGGTIIDTRTILTAAHCFYKSYGRVNADQFAVHAGREDIYKITVTLQVLVVSKVIIYAGFNINSVAHDIALVKLSHDIVFTRYVSPVCLWSMGDAQSQIVGKNGTVIGFGKNERGELPGFLQEVALTVVDGLVCVESDRGTYGSLLTSNMFCARGKQGANACNGDSGGGIFFKVQETWYVRGIVSFTARRPNTDLCDNSKFTVFTDVSKYLNWISQSIDSPIRVTHRFDSGFILVNEGNETHEHIIRVPLDGGRSFRVIQSTVTNGIDHDCVEGRFYWSEPREGRITSANYDGTDRKPFITEDISWSYGVAVDWISRRLYWADGRKKTIEVASLENPDVRTVLISTNLELPSRIAVDPFRNQLCWSDDELKAPNIECSNLDGTERQLLLESPQIKRLFGIQVNNATGELCYVDGTGTNKIECINPSSKETRMIASNLTWAVQLAITDERFYWNNYWEKRIESINMDGVRQQPITSPLFEHELNQITLVSGKCPIIYSPCAVNNGGCSENTICLVNPRVPSGKVCKCTRNCNNN